MKRAILFTMWVKNIGDVPKSGIIYLHTNTRGKKNREIDLFLMYFTKTSTTQCVYLKPTAFENLTKLFRFSRQNIHGFAENKYNNITI